MIVCIPAHSLTAKVKCWRARKNIFSHFEKDETPPSTSGIWSISPHRGKFCVHNAINRYGTLWGMPLNYNVDGSLDVYIQRDSPGADKEANWLPCPPSDLFNLTIRIYG